MSILEKLGAKCYLSEALYQMALTYKLIGENEKSLDKFQEAIQLFDEMKAPKQVERVRRSMQTTNSDHSLEFN